MTNPNIDSFEPPIEQRVDELMKFSEVVNRFMDVQRATIRNKRLETDGEHTLRLQFIAVVYAARYYPDLNTGKVAVYALVHDFVEVYAGDVNSLLATDKELATKALQEKVAFDRLKTEFGETWPEFIETIHCYETLQDPEARFVKCFDKIDPAFTHHDNSGEALIKMGFHTREFYEHTTDRVTERMAEYSREFPDVVAIRGELLNRVGDVTYPTV